MSILFDAVLPVFGLVVVGYAAVRLRWLADNAVRGLSLFVFNFALPAMLFRTLARTQLPERMEWAFPLLLLRGRTDRVRLRDGGGAARLRATAAGAGPGGPHRFVLEYRAPGDPHRAGGFR